MIKKYNFFFDNYYPELQNYVYDSVYSFQTANLIIVIIFSMILSIIVLFLSLFIKKVISYTTLSSGSGLTEGDTQKISPYECGFEPFQDARNKFNIKFYLVGILFLIFDLEIAFLFPWVAAIAKLGFSGFVGMYFFLILLIVGFAYEWKLGALDW